MNAAEPMPGRVGTTRGVAVVTGAGGGIGAACAVALARTHGYVLCVDRDLDRAEQTAGRIRDLGVQTGVLAADVGDPGMGETVVGALPAPDDHGPVRSAVHAVAHEEHVPADRVAIESMITSYRFGPVAAFALFRALVVAGACAPGTGLTVIGSLHRTYPFRRCLGYNAAHAALGQVVTTLAHEWAPRRIRVNAVAPGWIATPGEIALYGEDHLAAAGAQLPFGTMGTPEQVAEAVAFLSSDAAAYVSGSTLTVDGALSVSLARLPGEEA